MVGKKRYLKTFKESPDLLFCTLSPMQLQKGSKDIVKINRKPRYVEILRPHSKSEIYLGEDIDFNK